MPSTNNLQKHSLLKYMPKNWDHISNRPKILPEVVFAFLSGGQVLVVLAVSVLKALESIVNMLVVVMNELLHWVH